MKGLFLDPRTWEMDFKSSPFWNPKKYGFEVNLHADAFNIPKKGIDKSYKFVLATEVWEIPMQKTLHYLREKGLKIFLVPREPFKTGIHSNLMFNQEKFKYKNAFYFCPDTVLSPSPAYSEIWSNRTPTVTVGYPRWDFYLNAKIEREEVAKKYHLDLNKKTIFFPSYPPYCYENINGKEEFVDLYNEREETLQSIKKFVDSNPEYQAIVKIHPMSFKCYRKKTGRGNEVKGTLEYYYKNPSKNFKVIGDVRNSGLDAKKLLIFSDIVVGFSSTMLLEAALINKKIVHVLFGKCNNIKGLPEFNQYMLTAHNYDQLERHILSENTGKYDDLIYKYLYKVDGKFCQRLCEAIKSNI